MNNQIWYCYLLYSMNSNRTYIGSTNNFQNRLKTHNLSKGAKYTSGQTWLPVLVIGGFCKRQSLSFEYKWKKLSKKRNNSRMNFINLCYGFNIKYSHNMIHCRIVDLIYFLNTCTLIDTKFMIDPQMKYPVNQPEWLFMKVYIEEPNMKKIPWPSYLQILD